MQACYRSVVLLLWSALVPAISLPLTIPRRPPQPQPLPIRFKFAPDTTAIMGPRYPNGYPNYLAALNLRAQMGVTHRNNAARAIFLTIDPNQREWRIFRKEEVEFGISWFERRHIFENREPVKGSSLDAAAHRPWKANEFQALKLWLAVNEDALRAVHRASRLTGWYDPKISDKRPYLMNSKLMIATQMRSIGEALQVRVLLHLGEGRVEQAWEDVLALHRLAALQARDFTLVAHAIAHDMESGAFICEQALFQHPQLTPELMVRIRREVAALPTIPDFIPALNYGERYNLLDTMMFCAHINTYTGRLNPTSPLEQFRNSFTARSLDFWYMQFVNWNTVLRTTNKWFDRAIADVQIKSDYQRAWALDDFARDIRKTRDKSFESEYWLIRNTNMIVNLPLLRQKATQWTADQLVTLFFPLLTEVSSTRSRCLMERDMINLGWALAAYKLEHKTYPANLEMLCPQFLPRIPIDRMNDKELKYDSDGKSFVLSSSGMNQLNEQARLKVDGSSGDDIVLRSHPVAPAE